MFAYCNNNPINKEDASGFYATFTDDLDGNGIADYLDIRWRKETNKAKAKQYIENNKAVVIRQVDKESGKAVECDIYFEEFDYEFSELSFADEFCKLLEDKIRKEEENIVSDGGVLAGSMTYYHIYGETMGHYYAFRYVSPMYESAHIATLNYDEDRWYVKIAISIYGHDRPKD